MPKPTPIFLLLCFYPSLSWACLQGTSDNLPYWFFIKMVALAGLVWGIVRIAELRWAKAEDSVLWSIVRWGMIGFIWFVSYYNNSFSPNFMVGHWEYPPYDGYLIAMCGAPFLTGLALFIARKFSLRGKWLVPIGILAACACFMVALAFEPSPTYIVATPIDLGF